jgi:hypothetical protein
MGVLCHACVALVNQYVYIFFVYIFVCKDFDWSESFYIQPDAIKLPEEEERKEGRVGWWVYYRYFQAGSGPLKFPIMVILNLLAQAAYIISDWWLARWFVVIYFYFVMHL